MNNNELKILVTVRLKNNLLANFLLNKNIKLNYDTALKISNILYDCFFLDEVEISNKSILKIKKVLIENGVKNRKVIINEIRIKYIKQYYTDISFYLNRLINGFNIDNDNITFLGNVYKPIGCNAATFGTESRQITKKRIEHLKSMPI
jgi:hypothetical protein